MFCRVLVGFNSSHYQAVDLSECLAGNPVDVLSTHLGLGLEIASKLPHRTVFIAPPVRWK